MENKPSKSRSHGFLYFLLLAIPCVAVLWPPFYASVEPRLAGVPFFYWYQFLWIILTALLTVFVYFATKKK